MDILVTGVNGFVGKHAAAYMCSIGYRVYGVGTQPNADPEIQKTLSGYYYADLTLQSDTGQIDLRHIDTIINLAGYAKVGDSKGKIEEYLRVNVGVHTTLYDECLRQGVSPRIIAVSTGAVYDPNQEMPITEESRFVDEDATNEYVISKQRMEKALDEYRAKGLHIITVRPFNHSGPGQLPGFLLPDLGEQILEAAKRNQPIKVGNLETRRDYTDVRDVARAYALLATCPREDLKHTVYNVCSGNSHSGKELLELLAKSLGMIDLKTDIDPSKLRQNEVMEIHGSYERLHQDTGWNPQISFETMIKDFANWKIAHGSKPL